MTVTDATTVFDAVVGHDADADPLLSVERLSKHFGGVAAVDDVTFRVARGAIYGVIGSNGAGKSTLLGMIGGAHRPTAGSMVFDGEQFERLTRVDAARRGIARAHQVPRPFRQMSVREHADVAARIHRRGRRDRRQRVDEVLERCGFAGRGDRIAKDLGLLDLKRLGVARAMALEPKLLLLDEVAAGLVGTEIDQVVDLVDTIRCDGVTIIMVEHVQALIRRLADRVLVLESGAVLSEGTPTEIASDQRVIDAYLGADIDEAATDPDPRRPGTVTERTFAQIAVAEPAVATDSTTRPPAVLELMDVTVHYGALPALRGCSISAGRGEAVAIIGANGAGKTTLARAISGMVPVTAGEVRLGDVAITTRSSHQRARDGVAICHEGRRLFAEMTIAENLAVAARHTGSGRGSVDERVNGALALFPEIADRRRELAGNLSGGQQQMVAIARALVTEPRIVIFDELSLGLAPLITKRILATFPAIRARGIAILLIEQNVGQALAVCDHAYVLDRGQVSFDGHPDLLADDHLLRAAYFGAEPGADASNESQLDAAQTSSTDPEHLDKEQP